MFDELLEIVKEFFKKLFSSWLFALSMMFTVMFVELLSKLFQMQVLDGSEYQETYTQRAEKNVTAPRSRSSIYDRNDNRLAYNKLAYFVTIQGLGDYPEPSSRNQILYCLARILDRRDETVEGESKIALNQNGEMFFTPSSDSARTRSFLNFYGLSPTASLNDPKGRYPTNITAREAFERKEADYESGKVKDEKDDPLVVPGNITLGTVNIIYAMKLTEYQKYETTIMATNTSNEIIAEINENAADLKGVAVEQSHVYRYEDSIYFVPTIDYASRVQEGQLSALNEQWHQSDEAAGLPEGAPGKYDLNDIVSRIGIEKSIELELQGEEGYFRMYVDNMGCPREIIEKMNAKVGDDVCLTINRGLQIIIYKLIEQQLAGIINYHLQYDDLDPDRTYDPSKIPISVRDAYYQLISNNMLSLMGMSQEGAFDIEKQIYSKYEISRSQILGTIRNELPSSHALTMNDLPKDMTTYTNYIYTYLSDGSVGIIQRDEIDQSSPECQAWRDGTISPRGYVCSGIAGNWVDTTRLDVTSGYSDVNDIFTQLVDHVIESSHNDNRFTKRTFRCPINDEVTASRELCLALYTQGVLAYDAQAIAALQMGGSTCTYQFIKEKVSNPELTSAQLAPDPCAARVVVMDVKTDEARALVTYPSYDNNLMSGNVDAAYFNQPQDDMSRPLHDNTTQAQKAPGPTFKPIMTVAALEEGMIGLQGTIECTGIYDQISKPIRCWIQPGRHNSENIKEGIQNSCNYSFAELAHRLYMRLGGTYLPGQGLAILRKYAILFGLDHISGVEISENRPQISSKDPERSAMGQSTHPYTNAQLSRYVTALTNRGNVFRLSLLDKLINSDGDLIKGYTPTISSHVDAADNTWNAVQIGMRWVIMGSFAKSTFSDLPVEVTGKIETVQEDKSRSNHAFPISFTPYSHPEIAVAVSIPYEYAGTSAATLDKKVCKYYYKYTTLKQIEGSGVLSVSNVNIGD